MVLTNPKVMTTEDIISDQKSAEHNTALNIEGGNVSGNCPLKEDNEVALHQEVSQETTTPLGISAETEEAKVTEFKKSFPWGKVLLFPFKLCWKIIVYTSIAAWLTVKYTSIVAIAIIFFALRVIWWFVRLFLFFFFLSGWLINDVRFFTPMVVTWRSLWGMSSEDDE